MVTKEIKRQLLLAIAPRYLQIIFKFFGQDTRGDRLLIPTDYTHGNLKKSLKNHRIRTRDTIYGFYAMVNSYSYIGHQWRRSMHSYYSHNFFIRLSFTPYWLVE